MKLFVSPVILTLLGVISMAMWGISPGCIHQLSSPERVTLYKYARYYIIWNLYIYRFELKEKETKKKKTLENLFCAYYKIDALISTI